MCEIIVNQDQDNAIRYNPAMTLVTVPMLICDKVMGINLMCGQWLLGSFDTPQEAVDVMSAIINCKDRVYVVPGFSDYDGETDFWSLADEQNLKGWAST